MQNELYHHGIKGMRWGVRRYQNKDGSLTPQGKKKYGKNTGEILLKSAGTEATILVGRNVTSHVLGHMGAGGTLVNACLYAKNKSENSKLRAYYAHH